MLEMTRKRIEGEDELRIVALGDSLTAGWMCPRGYTDYLRDDMVRQWPKVKLAIETEGQSGELALEGRRRVEMDVFSASPHLVIVEYALNDFYSGFSASGFGRAMEDLIITIEEGCGAETMLLTSVSLPPGPEYDRLLEFYGEMERIALEGNRPLAPFHRYMEDSLSSGFNRRDLFLWDGVHPSDEGYRIMGTCVFETLKKHVD
jgi:acyl-CoA thioesterase-1